MSKRKPLTKKQQEFIENNYKKMSCNDISKETGIGLTRIGTYMKQNGLSISKEQSREFALNKTRGRTSFTKKEDDFIADVGSSVKLRPNIAGNPKHRGKHFVVKQFLTEDLVKVQWQKDIEYFYKRELMLS